MKDPNLAKAANYLEAASGRASCTCGETKQPCSLIAITGGPGAGKTAILNIAQNIFCRHVVLVPEAATVLFSGGFWRSSSAAGVAAAQNAIFNVQRQLETMMIEEGTAHFGLCDRGTVDGAAYWPQGRGDYWAAMHTTREKELQKYRAVVHLRSPAITEGYNLSNPQRIESVEEAARVDEAIFQAWHSHPNRIVIEAEASFSSKITRTIEAISQHLSPSCCSRS